MLRLGDDARVGGVHAVDVAVDLASLRAEGRREGNRRRVGAATPERGDLTLVAHALVARDDDDLATSELVFDPVRAHLDDARIEVAIVREDAGLAAGEADRVEPTRMDRDREQRHRHALAGRDEHVELSPRRLTGRVGGRSRRATRERDELVGGLAHRADDHDHVVAGAPRRHYPLGHLRDLLHVGDRRAAELLDDDRHGPSSFRRLARPMTAGTTGPRAASLIDPEEALRRVCRLRRRNSRTQRGNRARRPIGGTSPCRPHRRPRPSSRADRSPR